MARTKTTGKGSRTISKGEQRAINAGKNLQRRIINTALRGITDIKVLIHRSEFSGFYKLGMLNKMLGKGKMVDNLMECPAYSRYTFKNYVQLNKEKLTLHFKFPGEGYGPSCLITTNKSTYGHLSNIYKRLPKLNITRLEYAIDLYCKSPGAVADLFYLVRRYLYRRNAQGTKMKGEKYYGWKATREINALYFITMGKSSGKHI